MPPPVYSVVRFILGVILLTAAALKGHQLATEPVLGVGILESRWFLIGVVEFELLFGLWLLSGLCPRQTWKVAIGCFSLFAGVSLFKALSGDASCGCFGRVAVNPWYTFSLEVMSRHVSVHGASGSRKPSAFQFAFVEVPPYGADRLVPSCVLRGRLDDRHAWFCETPQVINLADGNVVESGTEI